MYNRDEVIRQAAIAAKNHASGVARALAAYLASGDGVREAEALRGECVALTAGFETTAHDGSTYALRQQAAQAALDAWDRLPNDLELHAELNVTASAQVWRRLWALPHGRRVLEELVLLGTLNQGCRDERAVLWAIGEARRRYEVEEQRGAETAFARSIAGLVQVMGAESADAFVARLPDKIRAYAEAVLHKRG